MTIDDEQYCYEKKKKLASKLRKVQSVYHLKNIKDIIKKNNPNVQYVKNGNGVLLLFNVLETDTYLELESYVSKMQKK